MFSSKGASISWLCDRGDQPGGPGDVAPGEVQTGVFYNLSRVRMADIIDGTSHTAFFSEKLRGRGVPNDPTDMIMMMNTNSIDQTYDECTQQDASMAMPLMHQQRWCWALGEVCCTTYNHVSGPNTRMCAGMGFPGTMTNMAVQVPASSHHPGGVNLLMGDGAVRFIADNIDLPLWRALGTRNGREPVSAF
ncbi:MAG: DUF1559 domain-containing protein [Planctomycetes bacterium]|nr:DUF1559 domain-containing protein [Planctomycetota bacterium]